MSHQRGLSVAMIVKDEATMLPRFLETIRGFADELVVVDTGSTDETVALCVAAGARVFHRAWTGDFAAARNESLSHCTREWILVLDPDELISDVLKSQIDSLLDRDEAGAATLLMRNPLPHGRSRTSRLLRIFRNHESIRFHHAIHEEVSTAVDARLRQTRQKLIHLEGTVEHLGYVKERAAAKLKKERDLELLERAIREEPSDLYSRFKRLELARFWNDTTLWKRCATEDFSALDQQEATALSRFRFGGEWLTLIVDGLHAAEPALALEKLVAHKDRFPQSVALRLRQAQLLELTGALSAAASAFTECLSMSGTVGSESWTLGRPQLGLARVHLAKGELNEASVWIEKALKLNPRDPEALLAGAIVQRALRGPDGVTSWKQSLLGSSGASVELCEALAESAIAAGDFRTALQELGDSPLPQLRAQALIGLGEVSLARKQVSELLPVEPEAGIGVLVCDLLLGQDSDLELELEPARAAALLKRWLEPVRLSDRRNLKQQLCDLAPALEPVFPWLPSYVAGWNKVRGDRASQSRPTRG